MLRTLLPVAALAAMALALPSVATRSGPVAAGGDSNCALFEGGVVKCWGYNNDGQLGIGSTADVGDAPGEMGDNLQPVLLGTGAVAVKIAAGGWQACALLATSKIKCWGNNDYGQLGLGDKTKRGTNATEMGDNLPIVDLGTHYEAVEIACGADHNCAILADGRLKCWGGNNAGQLGLGDSSNRGDDTGEMGDNLPFVHVQGTDLIAVTIALGDQHTCAISISGDLFCWGYNFFGQLGLGTSGVFWLGRAPGEMENLQPVNLGSGRSAIGISLGYGHTCVLLNVGAVACFGNNQYGQIGIGSTSWVIGGEAAEMGDNLQTVNLGTGRSVAQVAAGLRRTCAMLDNGSVKCWGDNIFYVGIADMHIGDDPNEMGNNLPAVNLGTGRTAAWVGVGGNFYTCALLDDRSLKCWGRNWAGQLGQGNDAQRGGNGDAMGDTLPPIDFGTSTITDFCQLGDYGTFGNCTNCRAGTWAPVGIASEDECVTCEIGKFSPKGAAGCSACAPGTYSAAEGADYCEGCSPGTYSSAVGADTEATCVHCPADTYSPVIGAVDNSTCLPCPPKTHTNGDGASDIGQCKQVEDGQQGHEEKEAAAVAVAVAFGLLTGLVATVVGAVLLLRRSA